MESSRSKKSGNKDKHKKSKSKHKQSKETKAKAKAFALGVYTSLPAEGTFVPDAISKSPQMKQVRILKHFPHLWLGLWSHVGAQLPKEKKIDCACGVPEHPKMGMYFSLVHIGLLFGFLTPSPSSRRGSCEAQAAPGAR
jgi:hypothetical protein